MPVHTKWEILVQTLSKSIELFKSYDLFSELKSGRFSVFLEKCSRHFWIKIFVFHYLIGYHAFFYSIVSSLGFKEVLYTPVGVL